MARIRGAKETRAAIRRLPKAMRDEAAKPVKTSTERMYDDVRDRLAHAGEIAPLYHGKPGMQNITGAARRAYKKQLSRDGLTGRVGILKNEGDGALHLRIFFTGSVHQPARNVHDPAFELESEHFFRDQELALRRVLEQLG